MHGQVGVYGEARGEVGHGGRGLQDGGGVHPYSSGDIVFRLGGQGYESLFWLSLCEVGVDVVEDVGCVGVKVAACEGSCQVLRYVAGVVERIVGVLVLARSAWFVHAVTNGNPCWVGAGPAGRCGEQPFGVCGRGSTPPWGLRRCGGTMGLLVQRFVVAGGLWGGCGGVL